MTKATTKAELLAQAGLERDALAALIARATPAQLTTAEPGCWSAKDVLAHVVEWHEMVFRWHEAGLRGEVPPIPDAAFNWGQLPALNNRIYEAHRDDSLDAVLEAWRIGSERVIALIEGLAEDDLFSRGRYAWTRNACLADYLRSCGPSHWLWARKEIRRSVAKTAASS
jgi:hypothetical protein